MIDKQANLKLYYLAIYNIILHCGNINFEIHYKILEYYVERA